MQNEINLQLPALYGTAVKPASDGIILSAKQSGVDNTFADTLKGMTVAVAPTRSEKMTELYEHLLESGALSPEQVDNTAFLYGCEYLDSPMLYVGDWPIIRVAATGEIFTPEKEAYFRKVSDLYHQGRVKLYEGELAKGTPSLEIIKKIFDFNATLPEDFQKMSGWR